MSTNNSAARRAARAEAAAARSAEPARAATPDATLTAVIRRLCWRARGWAWRASRR